MNYAEIKNETGNEVDYYKLRCNDGNFGMFKTREAVNAFADQHGGISHLTRFNKNGHMVVLY